MRSRRDNFATCCARECNQYFPSEIRSNLWLTDNRGCKKVLGCNDEGCRITEDLSGCEICECSSINSLICPSMNTCYKQCKKFGRLNDLRTGCQLCKCAKSPQGPRKCPSLHDCFKKKSE